mmetsp:Transcript_41422/g.66611  ORF Transcript_41422/g.66611 Transcript_41422/m.66611 type:complete len:212 (+) Transcript_41422:389-1024(+)
MLLCQFVITQDTSHKTVLLATISPTSTDVEHTRETLENVSSMMGKRRVEERQYDVDVIDIQHEMMQLGALKHDVKMRHWDTKRTVEFLSKYLPEDILTELTAKAISGESIRKMGASQVRYRVCNGDQELGKTVYAAIRSELKRLDKIDREKRMKKARRDAGGRRASRTTRRNGLEEKKSSHQEEDINLGNNHARPPTQLNGFRGGLEWKRM